MFINKGISVDADAGEVVVEWEGTGPGVAPADTVDVFTCEVNDNPPRPCESAAVVIRNVAEVSRFTVFMLIKHMS